MAGLSDEEMMRINMILHETSGQKTEKINLFLGEEMREEGKPGENMNMVVVGPPGCGKTFSQMLPTILAEDECSLVIDDKKGYLYKETADLLKMKGYSVYKIDFCNFKGNMSYNFFDNISSEEDVMRIADFMIPNQGNADRFWEMSAKNLFRILVQVARVEHGNELNLEKFMEVFDLCSIYSAESEVEGDDLEKLMEKHYNQGLFYDAQEEYKKLKGSSDKTWSCILNSLRVELQKYKSWDLYGVTRKTTVPFPHWGVAKTALFVVSSDTDTSMYPMIQLLYRDMVDTLIKYADDREDGSLPIHVRFLIDDFASGVQQTNFENVIANCRSRNISYLLGFQSISQLRALYGQRSESILDCTNYMVFYGSSNNETNAYLSKAMQRPLREIQQMDEDTVCLIRRGQIPRFAKRVQTTKMPEYILAQGYKER